jgi:DnaJ-class molecular chaperone
MFIREPRDLTPLFRVLEIEGGADRQAIISAYRRLAAQHHPDRFHDRTSDEQREASARFIEITRAYETLLAIVRD